MGRDRQGGRPLSRGRRAAAGTFGSESGGPDWWGSCVRGGASSGAGLLSESPCGLGAGSASAGGVSGTSTEGAAGGAVSAGGSAGCGRGGESAATAAAGAEEASAVCEAVVRNV